MMWFRKRGTETESWKELLKLLELMRTTLAEHTAQISLINSKLLKRLPTTGGASVNAPPSDNSINDGFDEIRRINQNGSSTYP